MNGDQAVNLAFILGSLVLVGSALAVRRLPIGRSLKMAGAWLLIFIAVLGAFAWLGDVRNRVASSGDATVQGGAVRVQRDADGHYWVNARVNDEIVRFLIDSGATVTVVGKDSAQRARVEPDADFPVAVNTANGTIFLQRATAGQLAVGPIVRRDFRVYVGQGDDEVNVLGMNFLSTLSSWGTEGEFLVLRP